VIEDVTENADTLRAPARDPELLADLDTARACEVPDAELCLRLARAHERVGDLAGAYHWLGRVVDAGDTFFSWTSAAALLDRLKEQAPPPARRTVRLALTGSYTLTQLGALVRLAALRQGIDVELFEGAYGLYQQDLLDPGSELYVFAPEVVLVACHEGALALPEHADDPDAAVAAELARWRAAWENVERTCGARVIQHNFALRPEVPLGHLGARLPGSRYSMTQRLNLELGAAAGDSVGIVDCDRLAASFGRSRWFDDRYWHLAKQAVALDALPLLARHTVAVLAAALGLNRKCLVLDLDNTLWGGVIGEDGLSGIALGSGARGEAFVAFQEYVLRLKEKGVILAVASKNNDADARQPFEQHPDMRLRLEDVAVFVANWEDKPANLRRIAETLNIGLDSLVLFDDNPAERQVVRQLVPEVDVVLVPTEPAEYVRALSEYLSFETAALTAEDRRRTEQYRARAEAIALESSAASLGDFYRSLGMEAHVSRFDELHLPRIVQLIGKTNQFNLTTKRHDVAAVRTFMEDADAVPLYLRLRDRLADHGLVGVLIARRDGDVLDIDTWLMSCRVIGRTVEDEFLMHVCRHAGELGCTRLRGTYLPTAKNGMVRDLYARFGFRQVAEDGEATVWEYDLGEQGPIVSAYISEWRVDEHDSRAA
jgi:FkbH-like protein